MFDRDTLNRIIAVTGNDPDAVHNALLAQSALSLMRLGKTPDQNCNFSAYAWTYTLVGTNAKMQQILPQNPDRKFLQVMILTGTYAFFNFDSGPATAQEFDTNTSSQFQDFIARAIALNVGATGSMSDGAFWSSFGGPVPTNPVTVCVNATAQVLVIEGV